MFPENRQSIIDPTFSIYSTIIFHYGKPLLKSFRVLPPNLRRMPDYGTTNFTICRIPDGNISEDICVTVSGLSKVSYKNSKSFIMFYFTKTKTLSQVDQGFVIIKNVKLLLFFWMIAGFCFNKTLFFLF